MRHAGLALLLAVTALLASSCLDATLSARFDPDGSGTFSMEVALSEELTSQMGALFGEEFGAGELREDFENDLPAELSDRFRISEPDEGVGIVVEIDFDDVEELNLLLADSGIDGTGSSAAPIGQVQLDADDETVRFSAQVDAEALEGGDEFAMFLGEMAEPAITFTVELPGDIRDNNADSVDGRRATWDLTQTPGGEIFAQSGTAPTSFASPLLIGGVAALALLALIVLVFARRRTRTATATVPPPRGGFPAQPSPGPSGWGPGVAQTPGVPPTPTAPPTAPSVHGQLPSLPPFGVTTGATQAPPTLPSVSPVPTPPHQTAPTVPTPPPATEGPPAGWYPDPGGSDRQRWWDGTVWTEQLS